MSERKTDEELQEYLQKKRELLRKYKLTLIPDADVKPDPDVNFGSLLKAHFKAGPIVDRPRRSPAHWWRQYFFPYPPGNPIAWDLEEE